MHNIDGHITIRLLGGDGASREPTQMHVESIAGVAQDIRTGARIAVAAGTEHELVGWGTLSGPAICLALDWPEADGWAVYRDRSIPLAEIERARESGIEIPTVQV